MSRRKQTTPNKVNCHAGKDAKGQIGQATVALQEGFGESCPGEWTPGISPTLGHLQVGETVRHWASRDHGASGLGKARALMPLWPSRPVFSGEHVFAGLEEHTRQAMMKRDFPGLLGDQPPSAPPLPERDSSSCGGSSSSSEFCPFGRGKVAAGGRPAALSPLCASACHKETLLCLAGDSEGEGEAGQDSVPSPASEADGAVAPRVKKELEPAEQLGPRKQVGLSASPAALMGLSRCPLCQLECGSREQLIAHVYQPSLQHTAAAVVSAKSYLCPVCGRALSSPGSLGRHLLIHSEDQLSNCAVCGARFTSHATFNSDKVPEVVCGEALPVALPAEGASNAEEDQAATPGPPVYPAGILLVCNSCVAYRRLLEAQAPSVRKWALRRQNEPVEVRLQRLERERTAKKSRRDNETPEEREVRRMRDREAKRLQRLQETDEQRARRLQRDREAMRLKRASETPEKRQARLIREREAKRLKRRLEKMDLMLRAQFGQDPSAMAALAAEMNFFPLPVGSMEMDSPLLGKMAFEEPSPAQLH
ncbi:hypothetical protein lerEdw1_011467 [Lerista edwardsae]|nr:hypothetical protein lerEdw1_011467 [Lerista edwardsae]